MEPITINFTDPVERAISFALGAHAGQKRGELPDWSQNGLPLPFIFHPMEVAKKIWDWGAATPVRLQSAVLHDTDEDTDYDIEMIRDFFGSEVANVVQELSFHEDPSWDQQTKKRNKFEYIAGFSTKSLDALIIKIADRLCNVEDFGRSQPKYARKYFHKADKLFDAMFFRRKEMVDSLGETATAAIIEDYSKVKRGLPLE
jgi:(p)ppGpp synthase/HD superfamily hydrolase